MLRGQAIITDMKVMRLHLKNFDLAYTPEKAQPTISASDMDKVNVAESDDAITVTGKTSKTKRQSI